MKRLFKFLVVWLCSLSSQAQNDLRIVSACTQVIQVEYKGQLNSNFPMAEVLWRDLPGELVVIKVHMGDKVYTHTLTLLYMGQPTMGVEFDYSINEHGKMRFLGYNQITRVHEPIVPGPPAIDTTKKMKYARLSTLCELREGLPYFYNNAPPEAVCRVGMPDDYMAYIRYLLNPRPQGDRLVIISNIIKNNCVTVQQLGFLIGFLDLETERVKIIREACYHIVDKTNIITLEKLMKYESAKKMVAELSEACQTNKLNDLCRTPSAPDLMAKWWELIQSQPNQGKKWSALKTQAASVCLTHNQMYNTIRLFETDAERLEVAKLLVSRCMEKSRLKELEVLFNTADNKALFQKIITQQK